MKPDLNAPSLLPGIAEREQETSPPGRRILREQATIAAMVHIFCADRHPHLPRCPRTLCDDCDRLLRYAQRRLDTCPFQEAKPACNHCEVHCYSRSMRQRVRAVMRYSGPRMMLRHPVLSLFHLVDSWRRVPARRVSTPKNAGQ